MEYSFGLAISATSKGCTYVSLLGRSVVSGDWSLRNVAGYSTGGGLSHDELELGCMLGTGMERCDFRSSKSDGSKSLEFLRGHT